MTNVAILVQPAGHAKVSFFNSKEVYAVKIFDTKRKAENYAKKYGYTVFYSLPAEVDTLVNFD